MRTPVPVSPLSPLPSLTRGRGGHPDDASADSSARDEEVRDERALRCRGCGAVIAHPDDIFSMVPEGPVGLWVNPHGFLHEVVTVRRARNILLAGEPTEAFTWFAGYAWTIAACANCAAHIGWLFASTQEASPREFWGLRRAALAEGGA